MKSILPIIFVVLVLTGAITYSLAKRALPQKPIDSIGVPANETENDSTLTPTPTVTITTPSVTTLIPSVTPTVMPKVTEKGITKGGQSVTASTTVTKTTICTPVYGSADTCTEHVTVDTGADSAAFFNFAGIAYLGGLLSFVKAKTLKH